MTPVRDHCELTLEGSPVIPSPVIMMLFNGWDIVTLCIVTGIEDFVESKTKLQLRRNVGSATFISTFVNEMLPDENCELSSKEALQPARLDVIVTVSTEIVALVNEVNPIQNPT